MFARLTSVSIALIAMIGAVAAADDATCTLNHVCCQNAQNTPKGWQGTPCTELFPDEQCPDTELCCMYFDDITAWSCYPLGPTP